MSPLALVMNERSYHVQFRKEKAERHLSHLVQLLREMTCIRPEVVLVTEAGFFDHHLAPDFSIRTWGSDGRYRDQMRYLASRRQRSPYRAAVPDTVSPSPDTVDYEYQGQPADGLGTAHMLDGVALSFQSAVDWEPGWIDLDQTQLAEEDSGAVVLRTESVRVRHVSAPAHIAEHRPWMTTSGLAHARTPEELWVACQQVLPSLRFLPRVRDNLAKLGVVHLKNVRRCLAELQEAAAAWDPATTPTPLWPGKITPEGETRSRLCWFEDLDGERRCFDLHARYTPGAGRLHFRLDHDAAQLVIAYIGPKLP